MSISNISESGYSQAVDPNQYFQQWASKKLHARGDYVNISDEGRDKAEELAKAKRDAKARLPGMEDAGETGSSSAVNMSPEEQAEGLEAKIKALMDQLVNIMQGPLPPEEKTQMAQPIQQAISQLQAQLNELKAQMLKEKQA